MPAEKIEILAALRIVEAAAAPMRENNRRPPVGVHQVARFVGTNLCRRNALSPPQFSFLAICYRAAPCAALAPWRAARITGSTRVPGQRAPLAAAKQSSRPRAADDAHFGDASGECALGGFELQNHSAGNFVSANQIFDFGSAHRTQNFFAIEHAGDVREENQAVGADKFRGGRGHVIGVDVVKLAVGAQAHAGSDGNNPCAPERAEKIHIHFREIADEPEAAFVLIDLHRLGEKAGGVGGADADGGLSGQRNCARQFFIEQAGENHHGRVARFAIGDAQAVDETAGDAHARERGGEDLAAAVNHEQLVARAREFRDLPRDRLHVFVALEQRARDFDHHSHSNPAVSG